MVREKPELFRNPVFFGIIKPKTGTGWYSKESSGTSRYWLRAPQGTLTGTNYPLEPAIGL